MVRLTILTVLSGVLACGCSSAAKHMSAADFQRAYMSDKTQTLEFYSYAGETNGCVYMRRSRLPLSSGGPKERLFFTEASGLPPGFVAQMRILEHLRLDPKVEPDGAANRSQPIHSQTNRASAAAGSDR